MIASTTAGCASRFLNKYMEWSASLWQTKRTLEEEEWLSGRRIQKRRRRDSSEELRSGYRLTFEEFLPKPNNLGTSYMHALSFAFLTTSSSSVLVSMVALSVISRKVYSGQAANLISCVWAVRNTCTFSSRCSSNLKPTSSLRGLFTSNSSSAFLNCFLFVPAALEKKNV